MNEVNKMLMLVDEFMEFLEEQEIEFEGMQTALLQIYIENLERKKCENELR